MAGWRDGWLGGWMAGWRDRQQGGLLLRNSLARAKTQLLCSPLRRRKTPNSSTALSLLSSVVGPPRPVDGTLRPASASGDHWLSSVPHHAPGGWVCMAERSTVTFFVPFFFFYLFEHPRGYPLQQ